MTAKRKRGTRGPAPGTGGRPALPEDERAVTRSLRLHPTAWARLDALAEGRTQREVVEAAITLLWALGGDKHRAQLARLRLLWGLGSDADAIRHALEMADDMVRE
jgi:hypothetical protein